MNSSLTFSTLPPALPVAETAPAITLPLKLQSPLPASPTATPGQPAQPQTLTIVATTPQGELTLQTADGKTLLATTTQLPPPAVGTRLTATLPAPTPTPQPATPGNPSPLPAPAPDVQILARMLTNPRPLPQTTAPASTPLPATASPQIALPSPSLAAYFPAKSSISAIQTALNTQITAQNTSLLQNIMPEGPLSFSFKQIPDAILTRPATLTLTTPTSGTLTLTPQQPNTPAPAPVPVQLTNPTQLPQRQPLPLTVLPNPVTPAQPILTLQRPVALPTSAATAIPQPANPPAPSALQMLLIPNQRTPIPVATPLTARVLPQTPQPLPQENILPSTSPTPLPAPTVQQPVLLATGHRAVLQSPVALPAESTLVVEFPTVLGPAQVLRVQPSGQQPTSTLPQTATPTNSAAPAQLPLPAGTVVQGTLTGQNEQGQSLLTIQQPPQYAGRQIPLNLPSSLQAQLPAGTALTARVETNTLAQLITLNLTPEAQRAHTITHFAQNWPGLTQALNLLGNQAPGQANGLRARLPQLANLLPGLANFAEGVNAQEVDTIMGKETASLLRSMGLTFTADVQHMAQLAQTQPDTPWRGMFFPYVENPQDDPRQGGFFWRREKKDDPRASTSTRFIVQLSMSQIGDVQLDGLVTYPDIWLKLRRHTPPEPGFIEGLQTLVSGLLEEYGLNGAIAVETTATFPVDPMAELLSAGPTPLPTSA